MFAWVTWSVYVYLFQACVVAVSGLSSRKIEEIVSEHNAYRRLVAQRYNISNMNKLNWSDSLRQRADQILTCSRRSRRTRASHESLGRSSSGVRSVLTTWFEESRHFLSEHQACLPWNSCDRFRRMVNAEQTLVGCSLKTCGRLAHRHQVMVCLYEGGSEDSFSFKTGDSCTHCGDAAPFCEGRLCVPCNKEERSCDCRKSCHGDGVGNGTLNSTTCVCTCQYGLGPNCDLECKNPELYEDYDYCSTLTNDDCNDPDVDLRATLREYCPEQCVCRPYPVTSEGT
ncbi:C-type lectin domain family 18 member A-like [Gigantopelta aegis]|uniref:C-type lectin domain family 18 member A-like n=1 Tax=Gigantopelta aegis TaxID=1735272 RepID=UPI001B88E532|nr:C-type lectin domain family 18 member A-like [Gigantopelta aegis]